jgi:hypothetical protein
MWVLTAAGDMVNIAGARRLGMVSDFEGETMTIVAVFTPEDIVTLALIRRDGADNMREKATAMYRALTAAVRDGDCFCDFSYA